MNNPRGFILLLTFAFLIVLVQLVAALTILLGGETLDIGGQWDDKKLLYLADAGVERALREIRNDYTSTTQIGAAYLRASDSTGSSSVGSIGNIFYFGDGTATINNNSDIAQVRTFDSNYVNTRIISVSLGIRADRNSGGTGATVQVAYTTNGTFPQIGNAALTQVLTTTTTDYFQDITGDRTWTWPTITSSNFILRAQRTAGNRAINVDSLFLKVTYAIDTLTESWATGTYQTYPISLGAGTVQSVSITDEQSKVHLNTASQTLLSDLMQEAGIASGTAATLAANIVSYRGTKPFDSVEELQQVTAMTTANYNLIKDYVTVYSFINTNALRPTGNRAPVNINTAPRQVLEAIFDSLALGATDAASLATDIMSTRAATPFTCFYSADPAVTTDFYDFVFARAYLSASGNPDERDRVLDNADASSLIPVDGSNTFSAVSTEFCYDSGAFKVESVATVGGRSVRVKTILNNLGSKTFTTFTGDTTSVGTRKENFE